MKTINISDLKTHLSQYLKRVRKGEHLIVMDRKEAIAEIIPLKRGARTVFEQLARAGKLKLGSQDRSKLKFAKMKKLPVEQALEAVQADSL